MNVLGYAGATEGEFEDANLGHNKLEKKLEIQGSSYFLLCYC